MDAAVIFGARALGRTASAALSYLLLLRFVLVVPITARRPRAARRALRRLGEAPVPAPGDMSELAEAIWEQVPLGAVPSTSRPGATGCSATWSAGRGCWIWAAAAGEFAVGAARGGRGARGRRRRP